MNPFDAVKNFMSEWLHAAQKGRVTTAIAVPMLVGAVVQVLYTFDADPNTTTDWTAVMTLTLAGLGLTGAGPIPPDPTVMNAPKSGKAPKA